MKIVRLIFVIGIFLLLLTQIFTAQNDQVEIGVNLNETFTYTVTTLDDPRSNVTIVGTNVGDGTELRIAKGNEFNLSIADTGITIAIDGPNQYPVIQITKSNSTHSIREYNRLEPGKGYVSSLNWTKWETEINANPITYWGANFLNQTIVNGVSDFELAVRFNVTLNESSIEYNLNNTQIYRYDKITGVLDYYSTQFTPHAVVLPLGSNIEIVRNIPVIVSSNTTSSSNNTTSTSTTLNSSSTSDIISSDNQVTSSLSTSDNPTTKDSLSIPGFTLISLFSTFIFVLIIFRIKLRNLISQ